MHFDALTSGLESETHFRVEEKQIIAGRYVVIQYLGSGTFCHTVQCEDLQGRGQHRFVCVKVSKNTKDILDQNLLEVKLLKLLARRVSAEERQLLPLLLNVFYYRETLFIVYELLRDNLYHIYKYIEECHLPKYFTTERLREVAREGEAALLSPEQLQLESRVLRVGKRRPLILGKALARGPGAVLLGGCDKSTPGLLMGAISMDIPTIFCPAGPMSSGRWRGP